MVTKGAKQPKHLSPAKQPVQHATINVYGATASPSIAMDVSTIALAKNVQSFAPSNGASTEFTALVSPADLNANAAADLDVNAPHFTILLNANTAADLNANTASDLHHGSTISPYSFAALAEDGSDTMEPILPTNGSKDNVAKSHAKLKKVVLRTSIQRPVFRSSTSK